MPRLPAAVKDEVAQATRRRLLDAAAAEFAQAGYAGANINRISLAAGFAKGTVYNYYPSKRALMLALIDAAAAYHTTSIIAAVEPEPNPGRRLERFFCAGYAFVEREPAMARVIISAVYGPDPELRARVYQAYERLFSLIAHDILEPGARLGAFRPVNADLGTGLLMALYLGSCSQSTPDGKVAFNPRQVAAFLADGLRPRAARPRRTRARCKEPR